jgi:hypothetical protein
MLVIGRAEPPLTSPRETESQPFLSQVVAEMIVRNAPGAYPNCAKKHTILALAKMGFSLLMLL